MYRNSLSPLNGLYGYALATVCVAIGSGVISSSAHSTEASLALKPKLCIIARDSSRCRLEIDVSWHADTASDYCLYNETSSKPLQCWSSQDKGHIESSIEAKTNVDYWLIWTETDEELDREVLKIVKVVPEDRRRTRRRRHIWSVF